jgi:hypothetical protein
MGEALVKMRYQEYQTEMGLFAGQRTGRASAIFLTLAFVLHC